MENNKKHTSGKRIALSILCVVLAIILATLIFFTIEVRSLLGKINRFGNDDVTLSSEQLESILAEKDPTDPNFTGPVIDNNEVTIPNAENITSENVINILLVGQDRRPGEPRMHSDSMILCTVNKSSKTITLTSFLRDTWVYIPGYGNERLNVPYMLSGGFSRLNETLDYNFGVSADHNIEVDFSGFTTIIDKIGGVEIELTAAEANHLNQKGNWDLEQNPEWTLYAGKNTLNGSQALAYSRIRALDNDMGRSNRQRNVITALIEKLQGMQTTDIYDMVKSILPLLTTDMTDSQILGYVVEFGPIQSQYKIVSQRIPADGAYEFASIDGKSVIYLSPENLEKNIQILKDTILKK